VVLGEIVSKITLYQLGEILGTNDLSNEAALFVINKGHRLGVEESAISVVQDGTSEPSARKGAHHAVCHDSFGHVHRVYMYTLVCRESLGFVEGVEDCVDEDVEISRIQRHNYQCLRSRM
jgi:hypothetical protein